MKFTLTFLFLVVTVVANTYGSPAKGSTKAALKKKPACLKECTDDYTPVCAGDGSGKDNKSFGNECVLSNYNCETGNSDQNWYKWSSVLALSYLQIQSKGECPGGGGVRLS